MKLPKRDLPEYTMTLPYSRKKITYRPYTVKEERILQMAAQSDTPESVMDGIKQVIENCSSAKFDDLTNADFEILFLKLVSTSVSNTTQVTINHDCGADGCPKEHPSAINLDEVQVVGLDQLKKAGFIQKKDYWVVQFDDVSGISLKPTVTGFDLFDTIYKSTHNVFDANGVYDEFTKEELKDYLDDLTGIEFKKIEEFFANQPYCTIGASARCTKCKEDRHIQLNGVLDFLE